MIHRKAGTPLPVIHPKASELGTELMDCLTYNRSKRQRDSDDEKMDQLTPKKRKTYQRK